MGTGLRRSGRRLELLVGVLSLGLVLMLATVPLAFALITSVALVSLLARARERHAVALVSATVLLMTLLVELSLRAIPKDAGPQYFRPHEVLAGHELDDGIVNYRPNQELEGFTIPYGGLANLSPLVTVVEPRVVDFYTDGLGFRNRRDYEGQAFVLFGDSFPVGTANTQDAILSEVLTHTHGIPVYNAAYPAGEIRDYIARLRLVEKIHGADFRAIIVVFEGNDFRCSSAHRIDRGLRWHRVYQYIPSFVRELESYRVLYGLTRRVYHLHFARERVEEDLTVLVEQHGGENVAFLKSYTEKATNPKACTWEEQRRLFESVADRTSLLVFMPTKYRVYGSLPRSGRKPLPASTSSAFMRALAQDLSIPFLDLTPPLVAASEELLAEGRYTFWRDDTHWNPDGMRVAADAIAELLLSEGLVPGGDPVGAYQAPAALQERLSPASLLPHRVTKMRSERLRAESAGYGGK